MSKPLSDRELRAQRRSISERHRTVDTASSETALIPPTLQASSHHAVAIATQSSSKGKKRSNELSVTQITEKKLKGPPSTARSYNLRSSTVARLKAITVTPATAVARHINFDDSTPNNNNQKRLHAHVIDIYDSRQPVGRPFCQCQADTNYDRGTAVAFAHMALYGSEYREILKEREEKEQDAFLRMLSLPEAESAKDNSSNETAGSSSHSRPKTPVDGQAVTYRQHDPRAQRQKQGTTHATTTTTAIALEKITPLPKQPLLTPHMRSILVNWLVEVFQEYRMSDDAFHLSITLIDRMLAKG
jgi:hypothetical protein